MKNPLDLITIGRVSVDLYGQQIGSRLEDIASFAKAVGGCPANIAIGAARLGLKSALISRVGDEPMGRFVREQLTHEGVDASGVRVDGERLTALVLLSVRDQQTFPLIFYRENCADSALTEEDVDEEFVASARAVLVTGTHFSLPHAALAQRKAVRIARAAGAKVVLDIDYRPNLWGIGGHGAGDARYARSAQVTQQLSGVLPECDLIVGTEEEMHVAAGVEDTVEALRRLRAVSAAVIVCKRGPDGCVVFDGAIPGSLELGLVARGMQVEVYNVLGAGDAFLAGFLSGYLRDEPHEVSARRANACGAIAVSRLLCSSEFPTVPELEHYLAHGSEHRALREDPWLSHLHRAGTRRPGPSGLVTVMVDYAHLAAPAWRLARIAQLTVDAIAREAGGREGFGVLLGRDVQDSATLRDATAAGLWVARAAGEGSGRPLEFQRRGSLAATLTEWPTALTVTCRCEFRTDDPPELLRTQERELLRLAAACRAQGRELLLDLGVGGEGAHGSGAAELLTRIYQLEVRPDWWRLEPLPCAADWEQCQAVVQRHDPLCRGILIGLEAPIAAQVQLAATVPLVRGIAAGRAILASTAQAWLSGRLSEAATVEEIAGRFRVLANLWSSARDPMLDPTHQVQRSAT